MLEQDLFAQRGMDLHLLPRRRRRRRSAAAAVLVLLQTLGNVGAGVEIRLEGVDLAAEYVPERLHLGQFLVEAPPLATRGTGHARQGAGPARGHAQRGQGMGTARTLKNKTTVIKVNNVLKRARCVTVPPA